MVKSDARAGIAKSAMEMSVVSIVADRVERGDLHGGCGERWRRETRKLGK